MSTAGYFGLISLNGDTCFATVIVLLIVLSDMLEYPLLTILRIYTWLSGLTRSGVLTNGIDLMGVYPQ